MTIGAPMRVGVKYTMRGGVWVGSDGHRHVPNPRPGRTTHLWDREARTFGQDPLGTLPANIGDGVPDGAVYSGPRALVADTIAPGETNLAKIVDAAAALATDKTLLYTLVLSAKTYELRGFSHAGGFSACRLPSNLSVWGAGMYRTVVKMVENTSAYTTANCVWEPGVANSVPKCRMIDVNKALAGWSFRGVRLEGGKQGTDNRGDGHPYNGLCIDEASQVVVENFSARAIRGYLAFPPGETGSLCTNTVTDFVFRNIEVDGRELGKDTMAVADRVSSAPIMINSSKRGALIDVRVSGARCGGGGIAIWWSRDITTCNVWAHDMGGGLDLGGNTMGAKGVNHERAHRVTHYSPRFKMDRLPPVNMPASTQFSLNNDLGWDDSASDGWTVTSGGVPGTLLIVDGKVDSTSDVDVWPDPQRISVDIWSGYDPLGEGRKQLNTPEAGAVAADRRARPVGVNSPDPSTGTWRTVVRGRGMTQGGKLSGLPWLSGVFAHDKTRAGQYEAALGRKVDMHSVAPSRENGMTSLKNYWWMDNVPSGVVLDVALPLWPSVADANGVHTFKQAELDQAAAGAWNADWEAIGREIGTRFPGSTVRPGWEMNYGSWYFSAKPGTETKWKQAFVHVVESLRRGAGAANIKICFNVNAGPANSGAVEATTVYPGDAYVDLIGIDAYDWWEPYTSDASWEAHKGNYGWQFWMDFARQHGKRFMVPEFGLSTKVGKSDADAAHHGGDNPLFFRYVMPFLEANKDIVHAVSYFDETDAYIANSVATGQMPLGRDELKAQLDRIAVGQPSYFVDRSPSSVGGGVWMIPATYADGSITITERTV